MPSLFEDLWAAFYDDPQFEDMAENITIAIENFYVDSGIISSLTIPGDAETSLDDTTDALRIIPENLGPMLWAAGTVYHPGTEIIKGFTKYRCVKYHTANSNFYVDWLTNLCWYCCEVHPGTVIEQAGVFTLPGFIPITNKTGDIGTVGPVGSGATYAGDQYRELYEFLNAAFGGTNNWAAGNTITLPDKRGVFSKGAGTTNRAAGKSSRGDPYSATLGEYKTDKFQGHRMNRNTLGVSEYILYGAGAMSLTFAAGWTWMSGLTTGDPAADGTNGIPRIGSTTEPQSIGMHYVIKY